MPDWSEHEFESVVDKAKAIASMVNIVEVAELLGLEPDHNGKVHSPYNEADETPSCQLYDPDHFFDFSTGRGGDAIDLVMAVTGKTWGQAVHILWTRGLRAGFEPGRFEAQARPPAADLTDEWNDYRHNDSSVPPWAAKLGLPEDAVADLADADYIHTHLDGMAIAHRHGGVVRGIKTRALGGAKGSVTGSQYGHGLYAGMYVDGQQPVALITEGESDCWALSWHWRDQPVDVYALPCGAGVWRDEWLETLAPYRQIFVCPDNDQAGLKARDKIMRAVGWARASEFRVPSLYNDVRAAYTAGWRPQVPS